MQTVVQRGAFVMRRPYGVTLFLGVASALISPVAEAQRPAIPATTNAAETTAGWSKSTNNPVISGTNGTCFDIAVLRDNATYRMWLSWRTKASTALSTSPDGITWSQPPLVVLRPQHETGWEDDVNRPVVLKYRNLYHMWYTGQAKGHSSIGYATSVDGVTWTRRSNKPVLAPASPWEKAAVMCPHCARIPAKI